MHKLINAHLEEKIHSGMHFPDLILRDQPNSIVVSFLNPFSYGLIATDRNIVDSVDYWFADGFLLCLLLNLHRKHKISRASFDLSSIAIDVFGFAIRNKKRVAIIGATADEINLAVRNFKTIFPSLEIVFSINGYFDYTEIQSVICSLNNATPDVVIIGMGTPAQEFFALECKNTLKPPVFIFTCGGFITQTSHSPDYYHPLVKRFGLRWLQRAIQYPHVRSRLLNQYPIFVIRYMFDLIRGLLGRH